MLKRVLGSFSIAMVITIISLFGQVLTVPVLLSSWGENIFGEWIVLTNLTSSLTLLNLGVQTYVSNMLIKHYVQGEIERGTRILRAALRLYVLVSMAGLIVIVAIVASPSFLEDLNIKQIEGARFIVIIEGVLGIYAIIGGLLMSIFRVIQQMPRQLGYALIESIILLLVPITVAYFGGPPLAASGITAACMALIDGYAIRDVWRRSPFKIGLTNVSWKESVSLIFPSFVFYFVSLIGTLLSSGTVLLISAATDAASVVLFTTTLALSNMIRLVINHILNVLWPEITAVATKDPQQLSQWHRLTLKFISSVGLLGASGIILLGIPTLVLWTDNTISFDATLNLLLALYLAVHAPEIASRVFGLATNRQNTLLIVEITRVVVSGIALILLLPIMQVRGAALALIIGQTVTTVLVSRFASGWTHDKYWALIADWLWRGKFILLIWLVLPIGIAFLTDELLYRILLLIALILLGIPTIWFSWLNSDEKNLMLALRAKIAK